MPLAQRVCDLGVITHGDKDRAPGDRRRTAASWTIRGADNGASKGLRIKRKRYLARCCCPVLAIDRVGTRNGARPPTVRQLGFPRQAVVTDHLRTAGPTRCNSPNSGGVSRLSARRYSGASRNRVDAAELFGHGRPGETDCHCTQHGDHCDRAIYSHALPLPDPMLCRLRAIRTFCGRVGRQFARSARSPHSISLPDLDHVLNRPTDDGERDYASAVELGVLGPLQVRQDGGPVAIPGVKRRAIIKCSGMFFWARFGMGPLT